MGWLRKRPDPDKRAARRASGIVPAMPALPFDEGLFRQIFAALQQHMDMDAGAEAYVQALQDKHAAFARFLVPEVIPGLGLAEVESLLGHVFTARRRIFPVLEALGAPKLIGSMQRLLHGEGDPGVRLEAFAGQVDIPDDADREARRKAQKLRRAMHDFGAEMLHFSYPDLYPLMTCWVWDQTTTSGALREFIRGQEQMTSIPLGAAPEMFEGVRLWLADQLRAQGLYRDIPWWVDLLQAEAYSMYFRSMAEGMLSADFGRKGGPEEHLKKFLGIDAVCHPGRTRVKKAVMH